MENILVVIHLFLALGLIGLILIQHGKGADAGAAFGSGASATVFGASGSGNFLSRTTAILAALFFITSMALAWFAMQAARDAGIMLEGETTEPMALQQPVSEIPVVESEVPVVPEAVNEAAETDVPAVLDEVAVDVPAAAESPAEVATPAPAE